MSNIKTEIWTIHFSATIRYPFSPRTRSEGLVIWKLIQGYPICILIISLAKSESYTAVLKASTFPHQLNAIPPLGKLKVKKIIIKEIARPQSKPALVTSIISIPSSSGKITIIFRPPRWTPAFDPEVEYKSYDWPCCVTNCMSVNRWVWDTWWLWQVEYNLFRRKRLVYSWISRGHLGNVGQGSKRELVRWLQSKRRKDWDNKSDHAQTFLWSESIQKIGESGKQNDEWREGLTLRTNGAPNNWGREESGGLRTNEILYSICCTNTSDIAVRLSSLTSSEGILPSIVPQR